MIWLSIRWLKMLGEIIDKATRLIPRFMDIAKSLGLDMDDVNGLIGLAGLLVYIKSTSYQKSVKYLGLYKAKGRDGRKIKKYNCKAQRHLIMLTNTILWKNGEYHKPRQDPQEPINFYLSFSL